MLRKRIVPCLDVRGGRLVKGVNYESLRDCGDPEQRQEQSDIATLQGRKGRQFVTPWQQRLHPQAPPRHPLHTKNTERDDNAQTR